MASREFPAPVTALRAMAQIFLDLRLMISFTRRSAFLRRELAPSHISDSGSLLSSLS